MLRRQLTATILINPIPFLSNHFRQKPSNVEQYTRGTGCPELIWWEKFEQPHTMQSSSIQNILVPLDLSPFTDAATANACAIARQHCALVEGLVVLDLPEIAGVDLPYHAWMLPEALKLSEELTIDAKKRISDAAMRLAAACEAQHIPHREAEFQGVHANCILEAAAFHDIVVMGLRTFFHFETRAEAGDSLAKVLHAPTAPVLAVPKHDDGNWKNVAIAFDGSPHACRALKDFARFAQPYSFDVTVLMSADDKERAQASLNSAAAYLRSHGVKDIKTVVDNRGISTVIEEDFLETTDLIVAGIHARKHIKNLFVGSVTQRLIDHGHRPLFLS